MKTHIALCFFYFSCIFQHKQETLRRGRYSQSLENTLFSCVTTIIFIFLFFSQKLM
uniref:Uncharacterized protein n=1 Tax=Anguilla anguilla TaxID=7936 RepID=A0A0E9SRU0_ANGAN